MTFINDTSFFTRDTLESRAKKFGVPNPLALELLLWDYEIAANLQGISDAIILKGGAACQLLLPTEAQRGSVDVDLISSLAKDEIEGICAQIEGKMATKFRPYTPEKPIHKLPLVTYFVEAPTCFPQPTRKNLEIQTEILLEKIVLPVIEVKNIETLAVDVKRMMCYPASVLLGDKILTLAKRTIGIPEKREADYPKQMYDIDMLLQYQNIRSEDDLNTTLNTIKTLTKLEAGYREIEVEPQAALGDVVNTMKEYSLIDTPSANPKIKKFVDSFQQFLVSGNQQLPKYSWSIRALKISFLSMFFAECLVGKRNLKDAADMIQCCLRMERQIKEVKGDKVPVLKNKLMGTITERIKHFKELKGKPLDRVFWQAVTPDNISKIEEILK